MCQAHVVVDKVETDEPIENFQNDLCYIFKFFFLNRNVFNWEELIVNKYFFMFVCLYPIVSFDRITDLRCEDCLDFCGNQGTLQWLPAKASPEEVNGRWGVLFFKYYFLYRRKYLRRYPKNTCFPLIYFLKIIIEIQCHPYIPTNSYLTMQIIFCF